MNPYLRLTRLGALISLSSATLLAASMTGITELTPAGQEAMADLANTPSRYVLQSGGYKEIGRADLFRPIPVGNIEPALRTALSRNGFKPASGEEAPTVALTFSWGVYAFPPEYDPQNIAFRANFVAGETFARALGAAIAESSRTLAATPNVPGPTFRAAVGINQAAALNDPLRRFRDVTALNAALYDQITSELYYVVVSAYDPASIAADKPKLLWRTRLTVVADGVSPGEALPALVKAGAPLLGRATNGAQLLTE